MKKFVSLLLVLTMLVTVFAGLAVTASAADALLSVYTQAGEDGEKTLAKSYTAEELKKLYAGVGIDGSKPVITYCRIGERSSHTWFALSKILGYQVRNYDGSWTEYGNSVGVPINNPAGTVWAAK